MTRDLRVRAALVLVAVAVLGRAWPHARLDDGIDGIVFLDLDGDGVRDGDERGVAGVAVSNQRAVVRTDDGGRYHLADRGTGVVFVALPDGHRAVGSFWRPAASQVDFALAAQPVAETFTFVHGSDPHTSPESVLRLRKVRALVEARRPAFVLMTGDVVRDALRVGEAEASSYYALYRRESAAFPVPVWSVPGNHENFGIERHLSLVAPSHPLYGKAMYRSRLGPNYYSFTHGGVHFVGLDTVDIADLWYYGHVDADQLAWLKADLALVAPEMPIVTFDHIPFVSANEAMKGFTDEGAAPTTLRVAGKTVFRHTVSNFAEVAAVMAGRNWPLALGGHIHLRETLRYGSTVTTRFEQAAAIVGPTPGVVPAISGVTLYTVRRGVIGDGEFLPIE